MLKITMLGLALVAFALSVAMPDASADDTLADETTCSEGHALMTSPSGMDVCVFEKSVLKLEYRGFEHTGEPFDMFPVKPASASGTTISKTTGTTTISLSDLPEIGETAIVEVTYTNHLGNITAVEFAENQEILTVGWTVGYGFEVANDYGNTPDKVSYLDGSPAFIFREPVHLAYNESKTYRVEVRAVEEGKGHVAGVGYDDSSKGISLYLDDNETLLFQEHKDRYPAQHLRASTPPEPSDMFQIKSSNMQQGTASAPSSSACCPPVVSMSMLPSINETAVVEITYTNKLGSNVTDNENPPHPDYYSLGWVVSSGFEIVDSGGNEPWTMFASKNEPLVLTYREFVPLDVGESKTYRIEVRAVNEGTAYVAGLGYGFSTKDLFLYLDDEETLPYQEHRARYPEMHAVPERTPKTTSTIVLPLERAPISDLRAVDSFGNTLDAISVDGQIQLESDLTNNQDKAQDFAYLIQIRNENGVTVSLNWISGSLSAGQSFSPATSWTPDEAGTYEVTAFVWESIKNPTALSPTAMIAITLD